MPAIEDSHYALGHILHIGCPGLHVLVVHLGKHLGEIVSRGCHRVLGIDLL